MHTYSLFIASDHAGFELKKSIITHFANKLQLITDLGTYSDASVDYPDYAHALAKAVTTIPNALGIGICGSGIGISIALNKTVGIRAALCWNIELAKLAKAHNNANVICLPARFIDHMSAIDMVETFLVTSFEGGRHQNRIDKIEINRQ